MAALPRAALRRDGARAPLRGQGAAAGYSHLCSHLHTPSVHAFYSQAPLLVFKSPAYNYDPFNTLAQQRRFSAAMRPLVARHAGILFLDNFDATFRAAFQPPPALKFATGSTFHYLDAGRHLMAQHLLHLLRLVSGGAGLNDAEPAGATVTVHEGDGSVSVGP